MNNGRSLIKKLVGKILNYALLRSNQNRNERALYEKLKIFAPDISEQYSTTIIDMRDTLLVNRVYCQHAFQVSVVLHSIAHYYCTPKSLQYILYKIGGISYEVLPEQRYDLSNHITWLMDGRPGGDGRFNVFSASTVHAYAEDLKRNWLCDTVVLKVYK